MRAGRLLSLPARLELRGRLTTAHMGREFEVSRRNALREFIALRVAGFTTYSTVGPGGGCRLEGDFRSRLLHLSQDELSALFSIGIPAPLVELGVGTDLQGALGEPGSALPAGRSDAKSQRMRERIHLNSDPWSAPSEAVPHLATLHRAVLESRWVIGTSLLAGGVKPARRVASYGLAEKATTCCGVWAGEDERPRVTRVPEITPSRDVSTCPVEFNLSESWVDWCRKQESGEAWVAPTARVSAPALARMERSAGLRLKLCPERAQPLDALRPTVCGCASRRHRRRAPSS